MKYRVAIFAVIVLSVCVINSVFDTVVHPTASAATAVDQVLDDETSVVVMRSYDRLSNTVPVITWGAVFLSGLALFGKPLYELGTVKEPR